MAFCDVLLFPNIKSQLKGRSFQDIEEIKQNATIELGSHRDDFKTCFEQLKLEKCVDAEADYFEGDKFTNL